MPKPKKGKRLGGSPAHQRLILSNLATALFEHGRITTTEAKARMLRPYAEKLVTKAVRGDLHNRREVLKHVHDKSVVHTLFTEIGPMMSERPGGYTRITKIGPRKGDNAPMAVIELVTEPYSPKAPSTKRSTVAPVAPTEGTDVEVEAPDAEPTDVEGVEEQETAPVETPAAAPAAAAPAEIEAEGVDGETEVLDTEPADVASAEDQAQGDAAEVSAEDDEAAAEDEGTDSVKE